MKDSRPETEEVNQTRALVSEMDIAHSAPYYWDRRRTVASVVAYRMGVVGMLVREGLEM